MASPTQTADGKGIPNPLIAEGLLKNPKGFGFVFSSKTLTNFLSWNGRTTINLYPFPQ